MAEVIVFGTGQWAELADFYFTHDSPHDVVAFTVDRGYLTAAEFKGREVVAFEDVETRYPPDRYRMFIPISFKKMNHVRAEKYASAKARGYQLVSYVSSKATTWPGFTCGENCFIFEDNTIQPFVTIGNDVVMWSGNHIGHHSTIGDHSFLASHVVISGHVTVGRRCFFGVNATIRDAITIGDRSVIGAGALIMKSTRPDAVYIAGRTERDRRKSSEVGL
jgi:sugar O-acyltransferase (sialic acid O-acetyltransferase NeuD family)